MRVKQITPPYREAGHDNMSVAAEAPTFWRRPRLTVQALHTFVLPNGTTTARLSVLGWGWVHVRATSAPRQVPVVRRFVWGRHTTLDLTVPVGTHIRVVATNLWGSARTDFEVKPTYDVSPRLPQSSKPSTVTPIPPPSLRVPVARVSLGHQVRIDTAPLKPSRLRNWRPPSSLRAPPFIGKPWRMSSNFKYVLRQCDRVTATHIQSQAEEH